MSFDILSTETVRALHEKFMHGIEARAAAAAAGDAPLKEALTTLLIECARKNMHFKAEELSQLAAKGVQSVKDKTGSVEHSVHKALARISGFPSPTFSHQEKKSLSKAASRRKDDADVSALFNSQNRLYLRLKTEENMPASFTQKQVRRFIRRKGYKISDYAGGYATNGKQTLKIGKMLKEKPALLKAFAEDATRTPDGLIVVISRNTEDIARMSTGRAWNSCMGSGTFNFRHVPREVKGGSLIAYLTSENDPEILNPLARMLLKPYRKKGLSAIFNRKHIFVPEKIYGLQNASFSTFVHRFAEEFLNRGKDGDYRLKNSVYADTMPYAVTLKDNYLISRDYDGYATWYRHGQRHREDGPAIVYPSGDGEWYLNGTPLTEAAFKRKIKVMAKIFA